MKEQRRFEQMRPWSLGILSATLLAASAWACSGCRGASAPSTSSDAGTPVTDARTENTSSLPDVHDAGLSDGQVGQDAADRNVEAGCSLRPAPYLVRDWKPWTQYSCRCPIYVPRDRSQLPEPIVWEKCPSPAPTDIDCRSMKVTWAPKSNFVGIGSQAAFWYDRKRNRPVLLFNQFGFPGLDARGRMFVVADVDGPVHLAWVRNSPNDGCYPILGNLQDGVFSLDLFGDDDHDRQSRLSASELPQGQLAGRIGQFEPILLDRQSNGTISRVSKEILLEGQIGGRLVAYSWDLSWHQQIWPQGNPPTVLASRRPIIRNSEEVLFQVSGGGLTGLASWTKSAGTRPLRSWYHDSSRGAANLGTDGKVMVWVEGTRPNQPPNGSYEFDHVDVMAAPYTTDPAELDKTARRVTSSPERSLGNPLSDFVVGCGYAARTTYATNLLRIIRLSDGRSWNIPSVFTNPNHMKGNFWGWRRALGITCDEVFVAISYHNDESQMHSENTIARIRLDSLGPGEPAD